MRRILFTLFSTIVFVVPSVVAQPKIITSREYFEGLTARGEKWYERSRRVETATETLENGSIIKSVLSISEVLIPDRRRYYVKTVDGNTTSELEQITIDYMQYTRRDGGAWTKIDLRQSGGGMGTGSGTGSSRQCEQHSVESVFLHGMSLRLFDWYLVRPDGDLLKFYHSRKWVNDDGLLYRTEEIKGNLSPKEDKWREIVTYEYDPNVRIEAPIK